MLLCDAGVTDRRAVFVKVSRDQVYGRVWQANDA